MKRLSISLFFLVVLQLAAYQARSQTQRLAIPPQPTFSLAGKNAFHDVKAYCLDRHWRIGEPVVFKAVLAGDTQAIVRVGDRPPMSLREAIKGNFISVHGAGLRGRRGYPIDGTQLRFNSESDEPIQISFIRTVAMGETTLNPVNSELLNAVREWRSPSEFKTVQDAVWRVGGNESRLEALGFYGSGDVVRNSLTNVKAIKAFQREYKLPQNGSLDNPETVKALEQAEQQAIATFESVGFRSKNYDTDVSSVSDNIHGFEEFMGLPSTGKLTDSVRTALSQFAREYQPYVKQALLIDDPRFLLPDAEALKDTPNVITFQKGYFETADSVEAGKRNPLLMTGVLLEYPKGIEFWQIVNGGFVKRSTGEKAFSDFDDFSSEVAAVGFNEETLTVHSGIYKNSEKVSLRLSTKRIELSQAEMKQFIVGELEHPEIDAAIKKLFIDKNARPKLIVFRSPFSQGRGGVDDGKALLNRFGYQQYDPREVVAGLTRHYGDKVHVVIASDRERGFWNLQRVPKLKDGSQIGFYVDEKFKYSTETIGRIDEDLKAARIKVLKVGDDPESQTRIIVFANHSDEPFRQYLLKMAADGRFRDSIIALAVCGGSSCDLEYNSLLISKSGARAVIFYNREITGQAVQDVSLKFAELLRKEGAPNGNYHELWLKSVDEVKKTATQNEQRELQKLREIIIQVSAVRQKSSLASE
jgi:hypothetical protein